ncbi:SCAN domain-containing protein 3-like [Trichonephila clavipes]|nr:SCAN domain-containing protein 3-like [Trichonephila clavipes]
MNEEKTCLLSETSAKTEYFHKSQLCESPPLQTFLLERKSPLVAHFSEKVWVNILAYLCGIFNLMNELNLCLQGEMKTVFKLADKVAAFKAKLDLWRLRVNRGIFNMFQTLAGILGETEPEHSFSQFVLDQLSLILKEFARALLVNEKRLTN